MQDRLVFDSRYSVGVEQIDQEHQALFLLAGNIYDSLALDVIVPMREIRSAINQLVESTRSHFSSEELLMKSTGYPGLGEHRELHASLISRISDFEQKLALTDQLTPVDLYEFLCSWLGDHIQVSDKTFGEFVSQQSNAPSVNG